MLVLTRKVGEKLVIGDNVTVIVVGVKEIKYVSGSMRRVRSRYTGKKSTCEYSKNVQPIRTDKLLKKRAASD